MRANKKSLTLAITLVSSGLTISMPAAQAERVVLEEVVVTAQKRTESLQDVPISVSAVSGEKIAQAGISKMEELSAYVPNFTVSKSGLGDNIYMRGLGSGVNQGFEQTVGTYVDGIYRGRGPLIRSAFLDLERVEVLRGPQGTLFGKNTIAGALNLTSANPGDEFEASVSASYTPKFGRTETEVVLSGPLSDTFGARLALKYNEDDGYLKNVVTGKDEVASDSLVGRLTLAWDISNDLSANLKFQHDEFDSEGRTRGVVVQPGGIPASPLLLETELDTNIATTNPALGEKEEDDTSVDHVTLNLEYALNEHTLNFVSGWQEYDIDRTQDSDSTPLPVIYLANRESYEQFSQEVRLTSPGGEFMDYILGAYYQTSELTYNELAHVYAIGPNGLDGVREYTSDSDGWSVFGQFTFSLSDALRATAGLRYTEEEKDGFRDLQLLMLGTGPGGADVVVPAIPPAGLASHTLEADRTERSLTPSVNVQYDWGESMLYATASKGFKAGGFDSRANLPVNFEFEEEEVLSVEVGAKMSLAGGAAELNISAFWMEFSDLQTSTFDGSLGFFVENAAEAVSQGVEVDGRWRLSEALTLFGSLGYLDFEWQEFSGAKCFVSGVVAPDNLEANGSSCDLSGKENAFTPEWSATLGVQYERALTDGLELRASTDLLFKDNHYTASDLNPHTEQEAYTKFNARLALADTAGVWEVALVGKNLTDELTQNHAVDVPFVSGAYAVRVEEPRSLAIQAKYHF